MQRTLPNARLVEELQVPPVSAGGPLTDELSPTVEAVAGTLRAGARGVIVGRNVWRRERSEAETVLKEIAKLTHDVSFSG